MSKTYVTEDWIFNPSTLTLKYVRSGIVETLDPKSSRLLNFLIENSASVASREDIYAELYGIENARADGTITAYVSKLRKLLEIEYGAKNKYIRTIPKVGYQFVGSFSVLPADKSLAVPQAKVSSNIETPTFNTNSITGKSPLNESWTAQHNKLLSVISFATFLVIFVFTSFALFTMDDIEHPPLPAIKSITWKLIHQERGDDNHITLSEDGLHLAMTVKKEDMNQLIIKDSYSNNFELVFEDKNASISTPAFSKSGHFLAFITSIDNKCFVNEIQLNDDGMMVPESHRLLINCGLYHGTPKLSYIDDNNILFLKQKNSKPHSQIVIYNKIDNSLIPLVKPLNSEHGDYSFALNIDTEQVAFLRDEGENRTGVYMFNLQEQTQTHLLNVDNPINNLEWINNSRLVAIQDKQLHMIDINKRDIRPTNLAKVKAELSGTY